MFSRIKVFLSRLVTVKGPDHKSALRQYWEMLWLFLRHHLSPIEYYVYGLGRRGVRASKLKEYIVTSWAVKELRPRLSSKLWEPILSNKILFNQHMLGQKLPVAHFYGLFHPRFGYSHTGADLRDQSDFSRLLEDLPGKVIIVKPVDGLKGSNIAKYHINSDYQPIDSQGNAYSLKGLVDRMSRGNGFVIEECLANHQTIGKFNPSSLNTCRAVTFINRQGDCRVLFATLRFGRQGSVTDNWSAGGVAVGLDLATGAMGRGLVLPQFGGGWQDAHPDSKETFVGQVVPFWQELLDLVQRAAKTLPWCNAIGWDVAITPGGPVLVEGNSQWNPSIGQAFIGGLLTPELRRDLAELGLRLPA